jgi:hypothetical protein
MAFSSPFKTIAVIVLSAPLSLVPAAYGQTMPVAQQNALVEKYCAVCHDDLHRNGGLSLQHFDASNVDPSLAAMMVSKLKTGAIGAAGLPRPDQAAQDALFNALNAKSKGADRWTLMRTEDPSTHAVLLTATIMREAPPTSANELGERYRLSLTCRTRTGEGEMQLTWAPKNASESGRAISVVRDAATAVTYVVEGHETMGNGARTADGKESTTGPAATVLKAMPMPARTLAINNLFPDEAVVFPFDNLPQPARQELSACFERPHS